VTAEYVPTADQRALVENAAAFGITQADIAEQLKIDEKTLRTNATLPISRITRARLWVERHGTGNASRI
jgi:ethanolamine ammonia-lyase small subunit